MKKLILTLACGSAFMSNAAYAILDFIPSLYVGMEAQYNHYSAEKQLTKSGQVVSRANNQPLVSSNGSAAGIFAGSDLHENFGIELGYDRFKHTKAQDSVPYNPSLGIYNLRGQSISVYTMHHYNWHLDLVGHYPVALGVDLLGDVGIGRLSSKTKIVSQASAASAALVGGSLSTINVSNSSYSIVKTAKPGIRLGVGAQYKLGSFGARFMVRYQKGNALVKHFTSAGAGLFFQFF